MPPESMVVIAPPDLLPRLVDRWQALAGTVVTCPDTDIPAAIERVLELRPDRVALERLFAATSRGAALLARLKADPVLAHTEFRIVSHDSDYWRISPRRPSPTDAVPPVVTTHPVSSDKLPLDQHGTRRAARMTIHEGVEILIDGNPARLLDLSAIGSQVLSASVLKPNQRVRVSMVDGKVTLRFQATIVWARFELGRGEAGPRYRAGLEFSGADSDGVAEYARRHQRKG
jgi:PilZ domain